MNDMNMRNFIILAASALLLVSCNKNEADLSIYEGEYAVDSATVITMNGNQVSLADYSNAAIRISATTGNDCEITLINLITGQPEVQLQGTVTEPEETRSAAGAVFSGQTMTADRSITVEGITAESALASVNITEQITVQGIPGKWTLDGIALTFSHPDLETLDLTGLLAGQTTQLPGSPIPDLKFPVTDLLATVNELINSSIAADPAVREDYIELTADGYVNPGNITDGPVATEDIASYYIRPGDKTLNIFLPKSVVTVLFNGLKDNSGYSALIEMFELENFLSNPQSIVIPLDYAMTDNGLSLTADQDIVAQYMNTLSGAINAVKELILSLSPETIRTAAATMLPGLETFITNDNYTVIISLLTDIVDAFTSPEARYSVTLDLTAVDL